MAQSPIKAFTKQDKATAQEVFSGTKPGWSILDQEIFIDDKVFNFGQTYVIMEMFKGGSTHLACKVFKRRPPTFKSSTADKIFEDLSKQGLVEGRIKKGQTEWKITKEGRETAKWVMAFLQAKADEIEADKAEKKKLSFDEKIRNGYYNIDNETASEFKDDLFLDEGVSDNPLKDDAYQMAWEDGHSAGFSEVRNCFYSLADLIRKAADLIKEAKSGA
jgi:hypothetical protein